MIGNGLRPGVWSEFKQRFGVGHICELYAASDGNIGFSNILNFDNTVGFSLIPWALVEYAHDTGAPLRNSQGFMQKGDCYFNTGDLLRDIGFGHVQFVDRLGDTYRWKGENVSTTEVENVLLGHPQVAEVVAYGVEIHNTNGRAGM
ncbi:S27A5 synthetase, partial [Chloropsis hardwickii]|nr:S27A5 synthetase [Chloropsis hardwickii]